jgi:hypothetical protein
MFISGLAMGIIASAWQPWAHSGHADRLTPGATGSGAHSPDGMVVTPEPSAAPRQPGWEEAAAREPGAPLPGENDYTTDPDIPADTPLWIKRANASTVSLTAPASSGSGVIVDAEQGLILTNRHVVLGGAGSSGTDLRLRVQLSDGSIVSARVEKVAAWTEPPTMSDMALLRIENPPAGLVAARLAATGELPPETEVWVVGSPGCRSVMSQANCGPEQLRRAEVVTPPELPPPPGGATEQGSRPEPDRMPPPPNPDGLVPGMLHIGNGINPETGERASTSKPGHSGGGVYNPANGELLGLNTSTTQPVERAEYLVDPATAKPQSARDAPDMGRMLPVENLQLFLEGKVQTAPLEEVLQDFQEHEKKMRERRGGGRGSRRGH